MNKQRKLFLRADELPAGAKLRTDGTYEVEATILLPLVEGKTFDSYDHRYAVPTEREGGGKRPGLAQSVSLPQHEDPDFTVPRVLYIPAEAVSKWAHGRLNDRWIPALMDVTSATNHRTTVATILPRSATDYSVRIVVTPGLTATYAACLVALFNSIPFDYVVRQKLQGLHLSDYITYQLPAPSKSELLKTADFIVPIVLELICCSWDMIHLLDDAWRESCPEVRAAIQLQHELNRGETGGHPFIRPDWYEPPRDAFPYAPFRWDNGRRATLRAQLDAHLAKLYGLTETDLRYILDPSDVYGDDFPGETFRVLKDKESARYGEYRTKRLVLDAWHRIIGQGTVA